MVGTNLSAVDIWKSLEQVKDPEIPAISIVEQKIVRAVEIHGEEVTVLITPTFTGCPALDAIAEAIRGRLLSDGFENVVVKKDFAAKWSTDMLEAETNRKLKEFGIAPPTPTAEVEIRVPVLCPSCNSPRTQLESSFGSTLCRQIYYCNSCLQSFEKFKSL